VRTFFSPTFCIIFLPPGREHGRFTITSQNIFNQKQESDVLLTISHTTQRFLHLILLVFQHFSLFLPSYCTGQSKQVICCKLINFSLHLDGIVISLHTTYGSTVFTSLKHYNRVCSKSFRLMDQTV
jgi:hypothetical protein